MQRNHMIALTIIVIVSSASVIGAVTWFILDQHAHSSEPAVLVTGATGMTQRVPLSALLNLPLVEGSSAVQATNGSFLDTGAYRGVNLSSLVELVGGMEPGNLLNVSSTTSFELFTYENVYPNNSIAETQGPLILAYSYNNQMVPVWDAGLRLVCLPQDQQYSTDDYVETVSEELVRDRTPAAELAWIIKVIEICVVGGPTLTLVAPGKYEVLHIEQLRLMPAYAGWGSRVHSAAIPPLVIGPYHYMGVNLPSLLDRLGPLPEDYDVLIEASDGYAIELSKSQAQGNVTVWSGSPPTPTGLGYVTPLLVYAEVGLEELEGGPLRLAFVNTSLNEPAPWTDGKLWVKYVAYLRVVTDIVDWELQLEGLIEYNMTRSEFEQAASCPHHQTSYTDESFTYSGLPLWAIIAWIDQYTAPSHPPSFNDTLAASNYTIYLFDSYGQNVSWGSLQVAYNDSILLANKVNDRRLTAPEWPLMLIGSDVPLSSRFGNIIRIVLVIS